MAHVTGIAAQSGVAPQPVGYAAGLRGKSNLNFVTVCI